MSHEELLVDYAARKDHALGMGGPAKLEKRRAEGVLNARERLEILLDPGTFEESGLFAVSHRKESGRAHPPMARSPATARSRRARWRWWPTTSP